MPPLSTPDTLKDQMHAVRLALREQARARAQAAALAAEAARRAQAERQLFAQTVGPVRPLRAARRASLQRPAAAPLARQRERDEAAVMTEALSDEFDVETLLDTDESLSFRRPGVSQEVVRKLRRGHWSLQAQIDLHGLRTEAARATLAQFIRDAHKLGLRCVRVIHGKGLGSPGRVPVLKAKVQRWLVQKNEVMAFAQARASDGGNGALVVLLAPVQPQRSATG
jgi:DNA-nicking Smr family endonuclease